MRAKNWEDLANAIVIQAAEDYWEARERLRTRINPKEAPVSLSVAANTKVSDTVREILAASGTGVSLRGSNDRGDRGQRAGDGVSGAVSGEWMIFGETCETCETCET